jgi:hypothetical protein
MFVNKILHDHNTQFSVPTPVKVYYDIETADTNSNDVPNHKSMTAFISVVGMIIVTPDGHVTKRALVNNKFNYGTSKVDPSIEVIEGNECDIAQSFFRTCNKLAEDHNTVTICIGHNSSCNPRGEPYDLVWLMARSNYNLIVQKRNYHDKYSQTEGLMIYKIQEFNRLYFLDTIRQVGEAFI